MGGASEALGGRLDVVAYLPHTGEELAEVLLSGAQVGCRAVLPGCRICAPEGVPQIVSDFEPTCLWSNGVYARGPAQGRTGRRMEQIFCRTRYLAAAHSRCICNWR